MPEPDAASPPRKRQGVSTRSTDVAELDHINGTDHSLTPKDGAETARADTQPSPESVVSSTPAEDEVDTEGAQQIRKETTFKLNDWHETLEPKIGRSSSAVNKNLSLNRTVDGAIQSAVIELELHDIFEDLVVDQLEWSKEDVASLGLKMGFHAFVHFANTAPGGIEFTCGDDVPYEPGTKYELRIETMSIGK